jgi:DNA-binding response OmpR family regulator
MVAMNSPDDSLALTHRVLVVEDNEHTAHLLEFMLQRAGYDVLTALNGRDAQEILDNEEPVDIILLDLMLPYVSGFELIAIARDNPEWCYVPILVVSGKVLEQDIVKALDLGANDYVTKPFRPQELLARVRRLVATREAQERHH